MAAKGIERAGINVSEGATLALQKAAEMGCRAQVPYGTRGRVTVQFESISKAVDVGTTETRPQAGQGLGRREVLFQHGVLLVIGQEWPYPVNQRTAIFMGSWLKRDTRHSALSIRDHFEVQRICQKHLDNACSKTINIPQGVSEEELSELYMEYLPELKGVTIYPEGSRADQPLTPLSLEEAVLHAEIAKISSAEGIDSCKSGACEI